MLKLKINVVLNSPQNPPVTPSTLVPSSLPLPAAALESLHHAGCLHFLSGFKTRVFHGCFDFGKSQTLHGTLSGDQGG